MRKTLVSTGLKMKGFLIEFIDGNEKEQLLKFSALKINARICILLTYVNQDNTKPKGALS